MEDSGNIIDKIRINIEEGLTNLEAAQNDLFYIKLNKLKENENIAGIITKAQNINEEYAPQVYDGLKVLNAVIAQKSKEVADKFKG